MTNFEKFVKEMDCNCVVDIFVMYMKCYRCPVKQKCINFSCIDTLKSLPTEAIVKLKKIATAQNIAKYIRDNLDCLKCPCTKKCSSVYECEKILKTFLTSNYDEEQLKPILETFDL